jgi:hypothetical protein
MEKRQNYGFEVEASPDENYLVTGGMKGYGNIMDMEGRTSTSIKCEFDGDGRQFD